MIGFVVDDVAHGLGEVDGFNGSIFGEEAEAGDDIEEAVDDVFQDSGVGSFAGDGSWAEDVGVFEREILYGFVQLSFHAGIEDTRSNIGACC